MKTTTNESGVNIGRSAARGGAGRVGWLLIVALVLGVAGGFLYWRAPSVRVEQTEEAAGAPTVLSPSTLKILAELQPTIDLRLFAPVDGRVLPEALGGYLIRLEGLLAEYERVAAGKVRVTKRDPATDAAAKLQAGAAGVVPFGGVDGEIVYLGLTVENGARREAITPLAPEWEAALESDLSRAIIRVTSATGPVTPGVSKTPAPPAPIDPVVSEELLQTFPDLATRSFDEVAKVLRETALGEFKAAIAEMAPKVSAAQKALAEAQASKSAAAQQEALRNFQTAQAEQADKLKGITARLQERITVLERLKSAAGTPAPPN